jgi:hypothetical protein
LGDELALQTSVSETISNRVTRRVAGMMIGGKLQNHFHFLQSLQLRRSKFGQYAAIGHFD